MFLFLNFLQIKKIRSKTEKVNEALKAIKTQGERLVANNNGKMSQTNKQKIGVLYDTAMKQCISEEITLRSVLRSVSGSEIFANFISH